MIGARQGANGLAIAAWALLLAHCTGGACGGRSAVDAGARMGTSTSSVAARGADVRLVVPEVLGPITLDGDLDEPSWREAARTGAFVDAAGAIARPYSEARFLRDGAALYVALYAADEDIRAAKAEHDGALWLGDAFTLRLAREGDGEVRAIDVSPRGTVTDVRETAPTAAGGGVDKGWESGLQVAIELDGTLDDAADDDEEWVVEARLPLAALAKEGAPLRTIRASASRCDTPKDGQRRCGSWGGPGRVGSGMPRGILVLGSAGE